MKIGLLNEIVKRVRDLPSLPALVMDLLNCIDQESAGTKMLGERLARDQALAAKTLRLANSSFYGMQRKVASIPQAIAILGFDSVRTMVASVAVIGAFPSDRTGDFDFDLFWRHSITGAICAKALAKYVRIDGDQAFIAGLLHDIGRLILTVYFPQEYKEVLDYRTENKCRLLQAEFAVMNTDHTQVGRELAEHWKFPLLIQNAIAKHHESTLNRMEPLAVVVQIANHLVLDIVSAQEDNHVASALPASMLAVLGISESVVQEVREKAKLQSEEVCRVFLTN